MANMQRARRAKGTGVIGIVEVARGRPTEPRIVEPRPATKDAICFLVIRQPSTTIRSNSHSGISSGVKLPPAEPEAYYGYPLKGAGK